MDIKTQTFAEQGCMKRLENQCRSFHARLHKPLFYIFLVMILAIFGEALTSRIFGLSPETMLPLLTADAVVLGFVFFGCAAYFTGDVLLRWLTLHRHSTDQTRGVARYFSWTLKKYLVKNLSGQWSGA